MGVAFLTTPILGPCFTTVLVSSPVFILFHVILTILGLPLNCNSSPNRMFHFLSTNLGSSAVLGSR